MINNHSFTVYIKTSDHVHCRFLDCYTNHSNMIFYVFKSSVKNTLKVIFFTMNENKTKKY